MVNYKFVKKFVSSISSFALHFEPMHAITSHPPPNVVILAGIFLPGAGKDEVSEDLLPFSVIGR